MECLAIILDAVLVKLWGNWRRAFQRRYQRVSWMIAGSRLSNVEPMAVSAAGFSAVGYFRGFYSFLLLLMRLKHGVRLTFCQGVKRAF
jgi:hypothetical protein